MTGVQTCALPIYHDVKKLLVILNIVTAKDLHYLIKRVMVENDAVTWFSTIYDHINGTKNIDIRRAMDNLTSIKLKSYVSIMENIASIEEAFRIVKVATGNSRETGGVILVNDRCERGPRIALFRRSPISGRGVHMAGITARGMRITGIKSLIVTRC